MKILTLSPRKPILYPPGIISLILLPVFCLIYLHQHKAFVHYGVMDIAFWSPDLKFKFPPDRNYVKIDLNNSADIDQERLDFARIKLRSIIKQKDTVNGVNFHFGRSAKYNSFIAALDICQTEEVLTYAPYKDDIYAVYVKPKAFKNSGPMLGNDVVMIPVKPALNESITKALTILWAPFLVFLAMLFLTFRKLYVNLD